MVFQNQFLDIVAHDVEKDIQSSTAWIGIYVTNVELRSNSFVGLATNDSHDWTS